MTEENERRLTESEIAQLVAEEFARPMDLADPKDQDAFDFFARQERPAVDRELVSLAATSLFMAAVIGFLGSLLLALVLGEVQWAVGFLLVACALSLTGTLLAVFGRR